MTTQTLITRIKALRELAEKATPGPWHHEVGYEVVHQGEGTHGIEGIGSIAECHQAHSYSPTQRIPNEQREINAAHIASHNPAAMIELYDELLKVLEGR